jgi:predicted RNase H-like HicB family nuclease
MKYKGIIYEEHNGYWIDFPEIEGCHTQGDTLEELLENAKEVLSLCLEEENIQKRKISIVEVEPAII